MRLRLKSTCLRLNPSRRSLRRLSSYATTPCGHPLIDVAAALECTVSAERAAAIISIGAALRERGYFYCSNVPELSPDYIRSIYAYSRRAHALPLAVKRAHAQRGGCGSYQGPDIGQYELAYEVGKQSSAHSWDYSRTRFTLGAGDSLAATYPGADVLQPPFATVLDELYERQVYRQ